MIMLFVLPKYFKLNLQAINNKLNLLKLLSFFYQVSHRKKKRLLTILKTFQENITNLQFPTV